MSFIPVFLVAISIRITHHKNTPTSILNFKQNSTDDVFQSGRHSNLRPLGPKPSALPSYFPGYEVKVKKDTELKETHVHLLKLSSTMHPKGVEPLTF